MNQLIKQFFTAVVVLQLAMVSIEVCAESHLRTSVIYAEDKWTPQDVEAEVLFGRNMAAKMLGQYELLDDDFAQGYINFLGSALATYSSRPNLPFYFAVIDSDRLNAFATPGGYIFITSGALMQCQNEAELAGILAHEIGHVTQRHMVRQLNIRGKKADDFSGFMTALVAGKTQSISAAYQLTMDQALDIWHGAGLKSRNDELDADLIATKILQEAGYSVGAFAEFLSRVSLLKAIVKDRVRTHPSFSDRVLQINKKILSLNKQTQLGQDRFTSSLASFHYLQEERNYILKLLAMAPIVPDRQIQVYLNVLSTIAFDYSGMSLDGVVVVESKEMFFEKHLDYWFISTSLLNRLRGEAEFIALLLYLKGASQGIEMSRGNISAVLESMGYSSSLWQGSLLSLFGQSIPVLHINSLNNHSSKDEINNDKRRHYWQSMLQRMNQKRQSLTIHPLLSWLPLTSDENSIRYINLLAFAMNKQLLEAGINQTLKGVLAVEDQFQYVRMQQGYLIVSQVESLLNRADGVFEAMLLDAMLINHYREKSPNKSREEIMNAADLKTNRILSDFGYQEEGLFNLFKTQMTNNKLLMSETFSKRLTWLEN